MPFIGILLVLVLRFGGYNKNKIIVDPETAPIVRQIFRWKAEGLGNAQICRKLNNADIPSPSKYRLQKGIIKDRKYENTLWQVPTLITILKNPVYLGHELCMALAEQ